MKLYVGDTTEYLAQNNSVLITSDNLNVESDICHTSLGDVTSAELVDLAFAADEVIYYPPPDWTSAEIHFETEKVLHYINHKKQVTNYPIKQFKPKFQRRHLDNTLWFAGDGWVVGLMENNKKERFARLVADEAQKKYKILAEFGSSHEWQANQILTSDIRCGDIVVWCLTNVQRYPFYRNGKLIHVRDTNIHRFNHEEYFNNIEHHCQKTISLVEQIIADSEKVGYDLLLTSFNMNSPTAEKAILEFLHKKKEYFPIYYDNTLADTILSKNQVIHPGPKQHIEYANQIIYTLKTRQLI